MFDDSADVEIVPTVAPQAQIASPVGGVITDFACVPDMSLGSGSSPLAINGRRILGLHTSVPLWRDLVTGVTRGPDVAAVKSELSRLGFASGGGDRFDAATAAQFAELARTAGVDFDPRSGIPQSQIVWLASPAVTVAACHAAMGSRVLADEPLIALRPEMTSARLRVVPKDLVPGARKVRVEDVDLVMDGPSDIASASLPALAASESFAAWSASDGELPISGLYRLERPLSVWIVPPSAVAASDDRFCVVAEGRTVAVEVVASRLGQALLTADESPPVSVKANVQTTRCN